MADFSFVLIRRLEKTRLCVFVERPEGADRGFFTSFVAISHIAGEDISSVKTTITNSIFHTTYKNITALNNKFLEMSLQKRTQTVCIFFMGPDFNAVNVVSKTVIYRVTTKISSAAILEKRVLRSGQTKENMT